VGEHQNYYPKNDPDYQEFHFSAPFYRFSSLKVLKADFDRISLWPVGARPIPCDQGLWPIGLGGP